MPKDERKRPAEIEESPTADQLDRGLSFLRAEETGAPFAILCGQALPRHQQIAADDDRREQRHGFPQRPGCTFGDEGKRDERQADQRLVGDGIDEPAEFRLRIKGAGDHAIEQIGQRGGDEQPRR